MTSLTRRFLFLTALSGLAFIPAASHADSVISTIPSWDGSNYAYPFGLPNTATYGQTITAPGGGDLLTSFQFMISSPSNLSFKGYVYAWDNGAFHAVGSELASTAQIDLTGQSGFQSVTLNLLSGIALTPGSQYVLFASVLGVPNTGSPTSNWGWLSTDAYAGGTFVFQNTPGTWTGSTWSTLGNDLAFQANFTSPSANAVPEPSAVISMAIGGGMALAAALRRRRSA